MEMSRPIMELSELNFDNYFKVSKYRIFSSLLIIVYIWCLPLLSRIGFAEKNETTISGFIANSHATGALAALSFTPLTLMWEYQRYLLRKIQYKKYKNKLSVSLSVYQFFYGGFLVCTVNYVPDWLHTTTVVLFSVTFVGHSCITMYCIQPTLLGKMDLVLGIVGCTCLLFVKGLWFWFFECIGFTSMMLFTPIELLNT